MPTTPNGAFPYPDASDPLGNVAQRVQELAEHLEGLFEPWQQFDPVPDWETTINLGTDGQARGFYRRWMDTVDFEVIMEFDEDGSVADGTARVWLPPHLQPTVMSLGYPGIGVSNPVGHCQAFINAVTYNGIVQWSGSTSGGVDSIGGSVQPRFTSGIWDNDTPGVWGSGAGTDSLKMWGRYRVAL